MTFVRAVGRQRWLHFGARFRLARLMLAGEVAAHREFETSFFGLRYRGDLASYIDWSVFVFGAYEQGLLYFLRDAARGLGGKTSVYVDIGANVGQHAAFMARHAGHVHAFEPYAPVRRRLEQKIADNALANVTVHPVALGEAEGHLPFYAPIGFNQGQGTFDPALGAAAGAAASEPLEVVRADDWFPRHGIARADLVKIDVEGFEPQVLKGMRATLERCRPVIVMEWLPETRAALGGVDALRALLPADYDLQGLAITPRYYRLGPVRDGRHDFEIVLAPADKLGRLPHYGDR